MKKAEFTAEELQEFTALNCVAFDMYRKDCQDKGVVPPCWLCMSVEAKEEARKNVLDLLSRKYFVPISEANFVKFVPDSWADQHVKSWKEVELTFKQMREDGNPRAFFCGIMEV